MKAPVAHDGYFKVAKRLLVWALVGIGVGGPAGFLALAVTVALMDF